MIKKTFLMILFSILYTLPIFGEIVELGKTIELPCNAIQQTLVENPGIAIVTINASIIEIKAISYGKTYIYLWDKQNNMSVIPLKVVPKGYTETLSLQEKDFLKKQSKENLKIKLSAKNGESKTQAISDTYKNSWGVYQLGISGETNIGKINSFYQIEQRNDLSQLVLAFVQLSNPYFKLSLGDSWGYVSPLIGTNIPYQGILIDDCKWGDYSGRFFYGATNQYFWGQDLWAQSLNKNIFIGSQITKTISSELSIYGDIFHVQKTYNHVADGSYQVGSIGLNYALDSVAIKSEAAVQSTGKKALFGNIAYTQGALNSSFELKSIDQNFTSLYSYALNDIQSLSYQGSYSFNKNFKLYGKWYQYVRPSLSNGIIYQRATGLQFTNNKTRCELGYWEMDSRTYYKGGLHRGLQAYASQYMDFLSFIYGLSFPATIYVNYQPFSFYDEATPSMNKEQSNITFGLNHQIYKLVNAVAEAKYLNDTNYTYLTRSLMLYSQQLPVWDLDIITIHPEFSTRYEQHFIESFNDYNQYFFDLSIRFKTAILDDIYLNFTKQTKKDSAEIETSQTNIRIWLQTVFDTGIQLASSAFKVKGVIFEDVNRNGVFDENEYPLSGFQVSNNDTNSTSNDDGLFEIMLDKTPYLYFSSEKYADYQININNPYRVKRPTNAEKTVNLIVPITFVKTYTLISYFDANKNGQFDEGYDQLLPNSKFLLQGGANIISSTGKEKVEIRTGTNTTVSIDISSIPMGLIPGDIDQLSQSINRNSPKTLYFRFILK